MPVDAVVAAGGDGTISAVAGVLAGGGMPLGVLPRGTLNHFARDLGIPQELGAAAQVIATGRVRRIDVGEVNGQVFINNSSIGIYPAMVQNREEQRMRWRRKKWLAMAVAAMEVFRNPPLLRVQVLAGAERLDIATPLVFVGNNRYELSLPALGARPTLVGGELSLHVAKSSTRLGIARLALRGLAGRLRSSEDFHVSYAKELTVESARECLRVALDGEVCVMRPPLIYHIRPSGLAVIAGWPHADHAAVAPDEPSAS
jgi:diacylglycerol kinase family enzyme